ncbi:MAG: hypothetical protein IJA04_01705 [Bacteroidaceae bacterium]|nr:hypothetical protein [Bacteroidales bacterium]MBQ3622408.1 hypothetical protein [Bacteroidaceae bacterium]
MKNYFLFMLFATASLLVSCSDDDNSGAYTPDDASYTGMLKVGDFGKESSVDVTINEENSTLTLFINDAKFAPNMPVVIDITVKDINYTVYGGNNMRFEASNVVPYVNTETEPSPAYTFATVQGTIDGSEGSLLLYARMADNLAGYLAGKVFEFEGVKSSN